MSALASSSRSVIQPLVARTAHAILTPSRTLKLTPRFRVLPAASRSFCTARSSAVVRVTQGGTRGMRTSAAAWHGEVTRPAPGTGIKVHFLKADASPLKTIECVEGDDLLSLAHEHDVDLEGACEGSVACSTCHVILDGESWDKLPEAEDEENDMLDLAFGLEDTSRLGCQVHVTKDLDGMTVKLPSATRNMYVDGAKARTH